ncbi:MAG: endolytic transglycosylase MltG [Acidimicrobiales bacterium]
MTDGSGRRPPVRGDVDWDNLEDEWSAGDEEWEEEVAPPPGDEHDEYGGYEEYEELRPEYSRRRRVVMVALVVFALLVAALGVAGWWVRGQLDPPGDPGAELSVTIPTGSSSNAIADILENAGVIPDAQAFRWYLRFKGESGFQAGQFTFREDMAAWDALAVLRAGPEAPPFLQFTVPEGLTVDQMVDAIVEDVPGFDPERLRELLANAQIRPAVLPAEVTDVEGFLFPDTYRLEEGQDEQAALQQMAAQFDVVANEVGLASAAETVGITPYEAVIVASLIQEEAGTVEEMPQIARVIYNRLDEGMRLEIDASLCYGLDKPCADLTRSDLGSDNAYNTRVHGGLPPTPIALPGRDALAAALSPSDGPWLYYVRDPQIPDGGHLFTDDYDEFLAAKERCEAAGLGCG